MPGNRSSCAGSSAASGLGVGPNESWCSAARDRLWCIGAAGALGSGVACTHERVLAHVVRGILELSDLKFNADGRLLPPGA